MGLPPGVGWRLGLALGLVVLVATWLYQGVLKPLGWLAEAGRRCRRRSAASV